jgi:hypothetical protein
VNKNVFVSSTFNDLSEYRQSAQNAIRQLGAVDISMEHFGARDERPKDECLRLIREESIIFVGIYAHRYGFIPAGDDISIIEAEYNEAKSAGLPRLIYIVDDSTPWIPTYIDRGKSAKHIRDLKSKLKANHICCFFSNKDELAAKVAADLGRYFSQRESAVSESRTNHIESGRERRLIQQMKSTDKCEAKRGIQALEHSQNPLLVDSLRQFVLGTDEELAKTAIDSISRISCRDSVKVIALGLMSSLSRVRRQAAFRLGEMALSGRREDVETIIDKLIEASNNPSEYSGILEEIIHSIGKIGGEKALDALVNVIESERMPPFLKAMALDGIAYFGGLRHRSASSLYDRFVNKAILIIKKWPLNICQDVADSMIFEFIEGPLHDAVVARIQKIEKNDLK